MAFQKLEHRKGKMTKTFGASILFFRDSANEQGLGIDFGKKSYEDNDDGDENNYSDGDSAGDYDDDYDVDNDEDDNNEYDDGESGDDNECGDDYDD
ncbi:hypothetical protein PoB_005418800 [Plakobranchus ocellatus]|uniref:Uncharacterized protein n=1 Tax=Plakobranchus ocellatus TaxID=259542 RepID=A0AAV4C745_9GAST|nr:hypothetical protein PoB_005418800 [Plakobranchus ocellatus]